MPTIEIVAYTPVEMDKFIPFCIDGKRKPNGEYETDVHGRKITGVFDWLHSRKVPEAHFFHSKKGDIVEVFAATIHRLESDDVPWMKRIPGFEEMVKADGFLGKTTAFDDIHALLTPIETKPDLDTKFAQGNARLNQILERMQREKVLSFSEREFLAALRGDPETDLPALLDEINNRYGLTL